MVVRIRIKARGRPRRQPGQMNGLEREYAEYLDARKLAGEVSEWAYERYKIRLAKNCFLTVDFFVMLVDGSIEFHETKGFMEEDALVKLKVVAQHNWWFRFVLVKKRLKRDGGGFSFTEVGA